MQVGQGFSSDFAMFDDFSKWCVPKVLRNIEKSSNNIPKNLAKNEEKPCSTCLINPYIFSTDFGYYPISVTRVTQYVSDSIVVYLYSFSVLQNKISAFSHGIFD